MLLLQVSMSMLEASGEVIGVRFYAGSFFVSGKVLSFIAFMSMFFIHFWGTEKVV